MPSTKREVSWPRPTVKAPKLLFSYSLWQDSMHQAKDIEDIRRVSITLARAAKSIGIENIYSSPIIVQNIVATAFLEF